MAKKIFYKPADDAVAYTEVEIAELEKKLIEVYSEAEADIQKKMDDFTAKYQKQDLIYQKQLKEGLITQADYDNWKKGKVFVGKQWAAKKDEITAVLHNSNKISTSMINMSAFDVFGENSNYMAYTMEHTAGVNFGFQVYNTDAVARLIKDDPELLPKWKVDQKKDYDWNRKNLNNSITQGIIQGESLSKISKRVSSSLAGKNENLMNTFAKTGMTQAQNSGRLERMEKGKALGIDVKKKWVATLDGRTRYSHRELDGQIVDTDEDFKTEGYTIAYPGDPQAHPSLVYNCRCAITSSFDKYPSKYQRYDNIDGIPIDGMTYREWEEAKGRTVKPKRKDNVANKKLIGGINDPELTDSIHDYFLPENTRKKLSEFEELHSYDDFKEYLDKKGIELDTDLEKLKTTMSQDDIPAVKEMMQKVVTAIDSYEEVYGPDALSALKRIKLYDQDLDTHAAYHFNLIGEDDPLVGTIRFSDWNASGRDIYHELAHAVQDSLRDDDEDVIIFANRLSKKVNIPKTAYSGTGELVGEEAAENMAENMAFGFARGNKKGMKFIDDFRDEMNDVKPIAAKKSTTAVNGKILGKENIEKETDITFNTNTISQKPVDYDDWNSESAKAQRLKDIQAYSGFDKDKTERVYDALCGVNGENCYFNGLDTEIRVMSNSETAAKAKEIQDYINASPKYDGTIYRGMSMSDEQLATLQVGGVFNEEKYAVSSWSSKEMVGQRYASSSFNENGGNRVVFEYDNPSQGTPVQHLSVFETESEVLVNNKGVNYEIVSIEKYYKGKNNEREFTRIKLKEVQ